MALPGVRFYGRELYFFALNPEGEPATTGAGSAWSPALRAWALLGAHR
jgi:hypothetical protein